MPFTPLHMGPGLLIKAVMQGAFSLMVFGWTQILIDLQPLYVMLGGGGEPHGISHTYLGTIPIAVVAALSGKYLGEFGLRVLQLAQFNPIGWRVAFGSAFIGAWSHVLIDGVMHADMAPLYPFSGTRLLHGALAIDTLHWLCLTSAVVGGAFCLRFAQRHHRRRG